MCRPECQNISTLVPKCPRTELSRVRGCQSIHHTINSSHHKIAWQVDSIQNPCRRQWLHTLQLATLCVKSCFFPHLICTLAITLRQLLGLGGSRSCREVGLSSDYRSMRSDAAPLTTQQWVRLVLCSLALIMPSMLHTVSGYYLSSTPVISAADFLVYSPVTSWPCDVLTMWRDDGVWQLDCVTIWLVAGSKVSGHFSNGKSLCLLMPSVFWNIGGLGEFGEKCPPVGTPWR